MHVAQARTPSTTRERENAAIISVGAGHTSSDRTGAPRVRDFHSIGELATLCQRLHTAEEAARSLVGKCEKICSSTSVGRLPIRNTACVDGSSSSACGAATPAALDAADVPSPTLAALASFLSLLGLGRCASISSRRSAFIPTSATHWRGISYCEMYGSHCAITEPALAPPSSCSRSCCDGACMCVRTLSLMLSNEPRSINEKHSTTSAGLPSSGEPSVFSAKYAE